MQLIFLLIEYSSLIFYELYTWSREFNYDVNSKYCLFGGVKFTKNADLYKYAYSGYGIGFDSWSEF